MEGKKLEAFHRPRLPASASRRVERRSAMPDCFPHTSDPVPRVLTPTEACYYLRLDEGRESEVAMLKALDRLVENKLLRPALIGKLRRFDRLELDRFIERQTEIYGECA